MTTALLLALALAGTRRSRQYRLPVGSLARMLGARRRPAA